MLMGDTCMFGPVSESSGWQLFLFLEVILIIFGIYLFNTIFKSSKDHLLKLLFCLLSTIGFLIFSLIFLFISFMAFADADNSIASKYFVLNAAIKNTCYLDPQKNHCPTNLEQLISIEPQKFIPLSQEAHLTYQYYPQTNQYTLIVRQNDGRVAIFDPRLNGIPSDYGKLADFMDTRVKSCIAPYGITNPPPIPGPWDKIN